MNVPRPSCTRQAPSVEEDPPTPAHRTPRTAEPSARVYQPRTGSLSTHVRTPDPRFQKPPPLCRSSVCNVVPVGRVARRAPAHLSPALTPSSLYPMLVSTSMTADGPHQPDPPGSRPLVNQPALSPACQPANLPTNQQPARKPQANHSHDATRYNTSSTSTSTTHRPSSTRHDTIRCARAQIRSKIARPARSLSFLQVSPTLTLGRNTLESGQRTVCRRRHARPRSAASRFQLSTRHRPATKPPSPSLARPPIEPSPRGSKPRT